MVDAETLANNARAEAAHCARGMLARYLVAKFELAHVAWWLDQQHESTRAKAAGVACEAIRILRTYP